ncbi:MAG TPA: glycogen-binding domain-containing protein [Oligoflexia bacterium]|nr:glycogen-binding domain-containing protein [Oligoflexia bacterium]HMP49520.1 glycogen-binding domain-containing protein [Oligoflexia bacterium]
MENVARKTDEILKEIVCSAPDAKKVFVAGTFNDWSDSNTPMTKGKDGNWITNLPLSPGHYEYKFVIDGKWCCKPGCGDNPHIGCHDCTSNSFGTMNRVLEVV